MPATLELRIEEGVDRLERDCPPGETFAQTYHVRVVVLTGQTGRRDVMDGASTGSVYLVGCHADSDSGAADRDSQIGLTSGDRLTDRSSVVRIVDPGITVGPQIQHLDTTLDQMGGYRVLEVYPGVIGTNSHPTGKCRSVISAVIGRICVCHERSLVLRWSSDSSRTVAVR